VCQRRRCSDRRIFFSNPWLADNFLPSLVNHDRKGRIAGFLEVVPRPMSFKGQPIQEFAESEDGLCR
jgi:hypothetical protein